MNSEANRSSNERVAWCPCMGPIPKGVAEPCGQFLPDKETGADPRDCDVCGHREECHGR